MANDEPKFELPKKIERYLSVLSKLYAQEGKKQKQEIIVNAQVRVHEAWDADNWNCGHALYLAIPESLYVGLVRQRDDIQRQIKNDLNNVHNVHNEYIAVVFLEMQVAEDADWRKESGLLLSGQRFVAPEAENRIWGDEGYRLFLSHKSEVKKQAADLKARLQQFGISCFVAHEDIHPTKEWQGEIENALSSMDALAALMTDKFQDSNWTDQEVGFAFGRGIPIVAVKLGMDPYGFIGKFQALSCDWDNVAIGIVKALINNEKMLDSYIHAIENCMSFDHGNTLSEILPNIVSLSEHRINRVVVAYNGNHQLKGSFGFNGKKPTFYGSGVASHLSRIAGRTYYFDRAGYLGTEK